MYRSVEIQFEDGSAVQAASPAELALHPGDSCIVECGRVPEYGRVVALVQVEGDYPAKGPGPHVLRRATLQDQARDHENTMMSRMAAKSVHKHVDALKLPLKVLNVRYSFDRSVLHVTYVSEDRVEGGDLVRILAGELRTRIELKAMAARDAARRAGGLGTCGRQLCCRTWLKDFDAVSVKMAKAQQLPLNPATISGMCGRLKCCLKYEFDCYKRLGEALPKGGARVQCPEGPGCVWDKDILRQRVKVRLDDGRVLDYDAADIQGPREPGDRDEEI